MRLHTRPTTRRSDTATAIEIEGTQAAENANARHRGDPDRRTHTAASFSRSDVPGNITLTRQGRECFVQGVLWREQAKRSVRAGRTGRRVSDLDGPQRADEGWARDIAPLSATALEIPETMAKIRTSNYVFPGWNKDRPLINMTLLAALKK